MNTAKAYTWSVTRRSWLIEKLSPYAKRKNARGSYALANKEEDSQKLLALVQEINHLLEEVDQFKHSGKPPTDS
jgi:hypothetical protein